MLAAYCVAALGLLGCGVGLGLWLSHHRESPQAMTPAPTWDQTAIRPALTLAVSPPGDYEIRTTDGALVQAFSDGYAWKVACESLRGHGYRFLHNGIDRT